MSTVAETSAAAGSSHPLVHSSRACFCLASQQKNPAVTITTGVRATAVQVDIVVSPGAMMYSGSLSDVPPTQPSSPIHGSALVVVITASAKPRNTLDGAAAA